VSLKDQIDAGLDAVSRGAANVKDTLSEAGHRSAAAAEQAKRDAAGDEMTTGEKVGSTVRQGVENTKAEVDAAKRDLRGNG
jgi:hypothetical protein